VSATTADPTWEPLLNNPPYPEWVSGLCGQVGAITHAATRILGTKRLDLTITNAVTSRHYPFADQLNDDAVDARVFSGVHFRSADTLGRDLGRQVADWTCDHNFGHVWYSWAVAVQ
jgi:hypothetical protein